MNTFDTALVLVFHFLLLMTMPIIFLVQIMLIFTSSYLFFTSIISTSIVIMKLVMIFPLLILYLFAAFTSPTTVNAQKEEEDIIVGHRRLQEAELFADDDAMIPTAVSASPLKCKNSDSKLQLQLQTATGDTIPFFCAWAQKGRFSCTGTGPLVSHCPKACGACSKYKCADSEGDFIWKGEVRTCAWLNEKKQKNREKLYKKKPKLTTTCCATCNMCNINDIPNICNFRDILNI